LHLELEVLHLFVENCNFFLMPRRRNPAIIHFYILSPLITYLDVGVVFLLHRVGLTLKLLLQLHLVEPFGEDGVHTVRRIASLIHAVCLII
jgi:hypothetical protein